MKRKIFISLLSALFLLMSTAAVSAFTFTDLGNGTADAIPKDNVRLSFGKGPDTVTWGKDIPGKAINAAKGKVFAIKNNRSATKPLVYDNPVSFTFKNCGKLADGRKLNVRIDITKITFAKRAENPGTYGKSGYSAFASINDWGNFWFDCTTGSSDIWGSNPPNPSRAYGYAGAVNVESTVKITDEKGDPVKKKWIVGVSDIDVYRPGFNVVEAVSFAGGFSDTAFKWSNLMATVSGNTIKANSKLADINLKDNNSWFKGGMIAVTENTDTFRFRNTIGLNMGNGLYIYNTEPGLPLKVCEEGTKYKGDTQRYTLSYRMPTWLKNTFYATYRSFEIGDGIPAGEKLIPESIKVMLGDRDISREGTLTADDKELNWKADPGFLSNTANYNGEKLEFTFETEVMGAEAEGTVANTAVFEIDGFKISTNTTEYTLSLLSVLYKADKGGSITGIEEEKVNKKDTPSGSSCKEDEGYRFRNWTCDKDITLEDGTVIPSGEPLTADRIKKTEVKEDLIFTANFDRLVTVSYKSDEGGKITGKTEEKVVEGESPTGSIEEPADGFRSLYWICDKDITSRGKLIPSGKELKMTDIIGAAAGENLVFTAIHKKIPQIGIEKSADGSYYQKGDTVTYTLTVTNKVPGSYDTNVVVEDTLNDVFTDVKAETDTGKVFTEGNKVRVEIPELSDKAVIKVTGKITQAGDYEIPNAAAAKGDESLNPVNADVTVNAVTPEFSVKKLADKPAYNQDDVIRYTVTVKNIKENSRATNVVIRDKDMTEGLYILPDTVKADKGKVSLSDKGFEVNLEKLSGGETVTITFDGRVENEKLISKDINNKVDVSCDEEVSGKSDVSVEINYMINSKAENGTITEDQKDIPRGAGRTFTYEPAEGYYLARLYIDGQEADVKEHPKEYTFKDIVKNHTIAAVNERIPALEITKTSDKDKYSVGDIMHYGVDITQTVKDTAAANILISDFFEEEGFAEPENIGIFKNGEKIEAETDKTGTGYKIKTDAFIGYGDVISLRYDAKALKEKENLVNKVSAVCSHPGFAEDVKAFASRKVLIASPELKAVKSSDKEKVKKGEEFNYRVEVTSQKADAAEVSVHDSLDKGLVFTGSPKVSLSGKDITENLDIKTGENFFDISSVNIGEGESLIITCGAKALAAGSFVNRVKAECENGKGGEAECTVKAYEKGLAVSTADDGKGILLGLSGLLLMLAAICTRKKKRDLFKA